MGKKKFVDINQIILLQQYNIANAKKGVRGFDFMCGNQTYTVHRIGGCLIVILVIFYFFFKSSQKYFIKNKLKNINLIYSRIMINIFINYASF